MPSTERRRRYRNPVVAFLVGAAVIGAPVTAAAYWTATTALAPISAKTPALTKIATTCTSMTGLIGIGAAARVSWIPVTGATSYTLTARSITNPAASVSDTAAGSASYYDVRGGLLSGLAGKVNVTVVVNFGSPGWVSAASDPVQVEPAGLLGYLLGGSQCVPTP